MNRRELAFFALLTAAIPLFWLEGGLWQAAAVGALSMWAALLFGAIFRRAERAVS